MSDLYSLLARGYLPRELPPTFSSESLAMFAAKNQNQLPPGLAKPSGRSAVVPYFGARVGVLTRRFGIPNPIHFYNLAFEITQNWQDLRQHAQLSQISTSIPKVASPKGRAIVPYNDFNALKLIRARIRATARYILRTDITQFYPSVYTHSIPWSLHGKAASKSNRSSQLLGNKLDTLVRSIQDGQSVGVPIGPDTSFLIAEVIMASVDQAFMSHLGKRLRIMRYVDDFEIGVQTYSEAEEVLACLRETLREFELSLNTGKTSVIDLPCALDSPWVSQLRSAKFRDKVTSQRSDIISFFDLAFALSFSHPNDKVLSYAVQTIGGLTMDAANWPLAEQLIYQCFLAEPGTSYFILSQLSQRQEDGYKLDMTTLAEVVNKQVVACLASGLDVEVAWCLWAAMKFGLTLDAETANHLSRKRNSIIALLALDAQSRQLIPSGLDPTLWATHMAEDELYGPQWLLAYEANLKGWLPSVGTKDHVNKNQTFSIMKKAGVSFYLPVQAKAKLTGAPISNVNAPLFSFAVIGA